MSRKGKYIIYLHQEYFKQLCQLHGYATLEDCKHKVFSTINNFLIGEKQGQALCADIFIDSQGNERKSLEIYRLGSNAQIKDLKELRRFMYKQKKNGFIKLKK